ncbi:hypothetical protein HanPSC8_Chr10g0432571 [Helianthus annuus]|nr:hypothetical protein HanPSC8_Chr10g0432571 [Helianthus annuus]
MYGSTNFQNHIELLPSKPIQNNPPLRLTLQVKDFFCKALTIRSTPSSLPLTFNKISPDDVLYPPYMYQYASTRGDNHRWINFGITG